MRQSKPVKVLVSLGIVLSSFTISVGPASASAACQGGPGCVLPVGGAPPPLAPAPAPAPVIYDDGGGGGIGWLPILLALAAIGALVYFLVLDDDDEEDAPVSP